MVSPDNGTRTLRATLIVRKEYAETVRSRILEEHLFDPQRSIGRDDLRVYFPLAAGSETRLEEIIPEILRIDPEARSTRETSLTIERAHPVKPYDLIRSRASGFLGPGEQGLLPERWEMLGDCLILKGIETLGAHMIDVARVYQSVLGARYTLLDEGGISGELRLPGTRVLIPPADGKFEVEHVENSIDFVLDPREVMFSSGNVDERMRIPTIVNKGHLPPGLEKDHTKGEVVLDMFAGIGYFTLPIAFHCNVHKVLAIEKNPVSYGFLRKNVLVNRVEEKVICILGDNRRVEVPSVADRIVMGYVGGTLKFLPRALEISAPEGCLVHLHDTVPVETGREGLWEEAISIIEEAGNRGKLLSGRRVKSFAPRIDHVVLDIRITP